MSETPPVDDFAAAKAVYDQLRDLPKDRQERVLRWVGESLGIAPTGASGLAGQGAINRQDAAQGIARGDLTGAQDEHRHGSAPIPDIRTFVGQKAPASDNQFAAVVAYYYRFVAPEQDRKEAIGGAILQEAARLAGRKRLANPRQTLANARNMGYLDSQGRGEFTINSVGENLVALAMPAAGQSDTNGSGASNVVASGRRRKARKTAAAKKASPPQRKRKQ